ncbi:peroxidase 47 [Senna tora]|uniref:Peroxidase n=1 Tax=Senna tora TaxID=362788 RepID=A0A834TG96_9FABA|nr:peroxidase 47 [Senna tora]
MVMMMRFRGTNGLSMNYYLVSCPFVEAVVKNVVNRALEDDPTLAAALLRMHFHDCFIQGCDGSVLIDSTKDNTAEKDSPANLSLRGYEIIDDIKEELERQCPGVVSCADILAMAARDAVFFAGGPVYEIPKGRKDGRRSKIEDTINLPSPTFNASELIRMFGQHGFSAQEMVALSGAHTLGVARCSSFKNRLSQADPTLDAEFAKTLSKTCGGGDSSEQPFDATRNDFDNLYYNALVRKSGVLTSDQTLYGSPRTKNIVNGYALNQAMFFFDFQQAMVKMSLLDVKDDDSEGEIKDMAKVTLSLFLMPKSSTVPPLIFSRKSEKIMEKMHRAFEKVKLVVRMEREEDEQQAAALEESNSFAFMDEFNRNCTLSTKQVSVFSSPTIDFRQIMVFFRLSSVWWLRKY